MNPDGGQRRGLARDTVVVGLAHVSAYAYPLVSIPLLARALGPEHLGTLIFAAALVQILVLIIDFGFSLSSLRAVAVAGSAAEIAGIAMSTLAAKTVLLGAVATVTIPVVLAVPALQQHATLLLIGLALCIGAVLNPTWLLQGIGRIKAFAILTAVSRLLALAGLLLTVRDRSDLALAMMWQFAPALLCAVLSWMFLLRIGRGGLARISARAVGLRLAEAWPLFLSSVSTMLISSSNLLALGPLSTALQVAFYGTAERFTNAVRGVLAGVQQALLPRMAHASGADRRTLILLVGGANWASGIALIAIAGALVPWYLGPGYEGTVPVVRVLAGCLLLNGISSALTLAFVADGRTHILSRVMMLAAAGHLVLLVVLVPSHGAVGAALALLCTEIVIAALLLAASRRSAAVPRPTHRQADRPLAAEGVS